MNDPMITWREPALSTRAKKAKGWQRLSMRRLGNILSTIAPDAVSLEAASAMLHSDDFYVRYNAALLLSKRGDRDARLVMQAAYNNGSAPTRASVARHLHRFSWVAVESLLRQALTDPDLRVREGAIYALCDFREMNAYQLAAKALQNEHDDVRNAAAWSLQDCQDSAAVMVLEAVMLANDPAVRIKALEGLSANDSPEAVKVVYDALSDPDPDVAYNAVLSLLELRHFRPDNFIPELIDRIEQSEGERLESLLRGFLHATGYLHIDLSEHEPALVAVLAEILQREIPRVRMTALWLLTRMRSEAALALLRETYIEETGTEVKSHILRVAASLMNPIREELIENGRHDTDPAVRTTAETASAIDTEYVEDDVILKPWSKPLLDR